MPDLEQEKSDTTRSDLISAVGRSLQSLGVDARWHPDDGPGDLGFDGHLRVRWEGGEHWFPAQIKRNVRPSLIKLAGHAPPSTILITEHVTDGVADALQRAGWAGFVDAAGNATLSAPGLTVRVTGRTPRKVPPKITAMPFSRTGLPVTFGLLAAHLTGATWTQRELAQLTGTSLGSVNRVIQGLRTRYLDDDGQVIRFRPLVDAWTASYIETQPMMSPSKHYVSEVWPRATDIMSEDLPEDCLLSSELAAHRQGLSIRPATALIYCPPERRKDIVKAGRLRPDPQGSIALRPTFWSPSMFPGAHEVPRFLMKADLLLEDDPRLEDLARDLPI